jgi:argininosuccinate lyase
MKLWDKGTDINEWIEQFTIGNDRELDMHLAKYDVLGSLAHCDMLKTTGLLDASDADNIHQALVAIYHNIQHGKFVPPLHLYILETLEIQARPKLNDFC